MTGGPLGASTSRAWCRRAGSRSRSWSAGAAGRSSTSAPCALRPLDEAAYATTKSAVISLTRALAVAHGPDGIRVNRVVVGPVFTDSPMGRSLSAEQRDARRAASPLGVEGTSWDTAHAVRFLLPGRSRFITGQVIAVDGGVGLMSPRR